MISIYDFVHSKTEYEAAENEYKKTRDDFKKSFSITKYNDILLELASQLAVVMRSVDATIWQIQEVYERADLEEQYMSELNEVCVSGTTMLDVATKMICETKEQLALEAHDEKDLDKTSERLAAIISCTNTIAEATRHIKQLS